MTVKELREHLKHNRVVVRGYLQELDYGRSALIEIFSVTDKQVYRVQVQIKTPPVPHDSRFKTLRVVDLNNDLLVEDMISLWAEPLDGGLPVSVTRIVNREQIEMPFASTVWLELYAWTLCELSYMLGEKEDGKQLPGTARGLKQLTKRFYAFFKELNDEATAKYGLRAN